MEDWGARTVPYLKLDLSSDIQRIFDVSDKSLRKIKHNIRPQLVYDFTPEVTNYNTPIVRRKGSPDTGSLPTFISPLIKTNTLTYYLNNTLTAKNFIGKGKDGEDLHSYLDFIYFKIYQTYDFNEAARDEKTPRILEPQPPQPPEPPQSSPSPESPEPLEPWANGDPFPV